MLIPNTWLLKRWAINHSKWASSSGEVVLRTESEERKRRRAFCQRYTARTIEVRGLRSSTRRPRTDEARDED